MTAAADGNAGFSLESITPDLQRTPYLAVGVLRKMNGHLYLHLIGAIQIQRGPLKSRNNYDNIRGWVGRNGLLLRQRVHVED